MSLYIEYYEVETRDGYEYYFMPINADAKNKKDMDGISVRIWKFDVRRNKFSEIRNRRKDKLQASQSDLFKIRLMAMPVSYSEYYLHMQRVERMLDDHAKHKAKKSPPVD